MLLCVLVCSVTAGSENMLAHNVGGMAYAVSSNLPGAMEDRGRGFRQTRGAGGGARERELEGMGGKGESCQLCWVWLRSTGAVASYPCT